MLLPINLNLLLRLNNNNQKILGELNNILQRWRHTFKNQECVDEIISLYRFLEQDVPNWKDIIKQAQDYKGELAPPIQVIGYLIASLYSPTIESLKLHFAIINGLETVIKRISIGSYKFILIPFFEKFWFNRYSERKEDFKHHAFWQSKSKPYYESAPWNEKIKILFRIICHHLDYEPSIKESNWMDN